MGNSDGRVVHVVAHTHWDREWYMTFDRFNRRMIAMVDELIDTLEHNPLYTSFTLDGTTILLDDYLELRPQNRGRLERLIASGRILVGPWYVMPDEFLVSGESLVRNLVHGMDTCRRWNTTAMPCGYLVDVFGHAPQLPQILRRFGIGTALLYRGIGDHPEDAFRWRAPDGSEVLAGKLDRDRSYSTWYFSLRWPFDAKVRSVEEVLKRAGALVRHLAASGGKNLLALDGVDHMEIDSDTPGLIDLLNSRQTGTEFRLSSIEQYFTAVAKEQRDLQTIEGALYRQGRKGINNQLLKHVLSAVLPIKQANDDCETKLTTWAEPFEALCAALGRSRNDAFLTKAWTTLLQNHPHDSICGCSITRVHQDNLHRYNRVEDMVEDVIDDVLRAVTDSIEHVSQEGVLSIAVFNPTVLGGERIVPVRVPVASGSSFNATVRNQAGVEIPWQVMSVERKVESTVVETLRLPRGTLQDIWILAVPLDLPPMGYTRITVENHIKPAFNHGDFSWPKDTKLVRHDGTLRTNDTIWGNGLYELRLDATGMALKSRWHSDWQPLYQFLDEGDGGDGWNYRKPVSDSSASAPCIEASATLSGPLMASFRITHRLSIPVSLDQATDGRSAKKRTMELTVEVTMRSQDPMLDISVSFENTCTGHRLRMLFPFAGDLRRFSTSTPFAVTDWDAGSLMVMDVQEEPSAVVPNQGCIAVRTAQACLHVSNKGLYECELDRTGFLSVTLLRSFEHEVGRRYQAGVLGRALGPQTMQLAVAVEDPEIPDSVLLSRTLAWKAGTRSIVQGGIPDHAGVYSRIHSSSRVKPDFTLPSAKSFVSLRTGQAVLSSLQWVEGALVIRLYSIADLEEHIEVALPFQVGSAVKASPDGYTLAQAGRPLEVQGSTLRFTLKAREILTISIIPIDSQKGEA